MTKRLISVFLLIIGGLYFPVIPAKAQTPGFTKNMAASIAIGITGVDPNIDCGDICSDKPQNLAKYLSGDVDPDAGAEGLLPAVGKITASLYQEQPSSREYIASLIDNIGLPRVTSAYAQGTGYTAMSPFLTFWQGFRNLAYSLYIIMFIVVGVMIMLRTKVNAQTVITIQAALPNLVITLLLITFSYAIVGLMIDLMYFLIYFIVYLLSAVNIIGSPTSAIDRLLSYSAYSVVFEGRNSIISAVALAIQDILTGSLGAVTTLARIGAAVGTVGLTEIVGNAFFYLLVAIWLGITMLKLVWVLLKSYVMLIVQTVTSPLQILMNAMPGSKAFGNWLKKTASYLLPFPVAAAMFIMAAVFIGDPTKGTLGRDVFGLVETNPFGINTSSPFYGQEDKLWLPPFTFQSSNWNSRDIMVLIGFFIFTMTPAVVKMAQEWLQVKESPYTAEAFGGLAAGWQLFQGARGWKHSQEQMRLLEAQTKYYSKGAGEKS